MPLTAKEKRRAYDKAYRKANPGKVAAYNRTYRKANPETIVAKGKAYYKANAEKRRAYGKAYREANGEKRRAYDKAYRKANPGKDAARRKAWRKANPEKIAAYEKAYREANPERCHARGALRRARKRNAPRIERVRRRDVFDRDDWRCQMCGWKVRDNVSANHRRKANMDHIIALAKGGSHTMDNMQTLCCRCNGKKGVGPGGQLRFGWKIAGADPT